MSNTRILLDNNVWRYLCDIEGEMKKVEAACARRDIRILISPSVVYEALRTGDSSVRRKLLTAMTRRTWQRLMPEAFELAGEFIDEVRRCRSEWLVHNALASARRQMLIGDWTNSKTGFWWRARNDPGGVARQIDSANPDLLSRARDDARQRRGEALSAGIAFETVDFVECLSRPKAGLAGWNGDEVERWRLDALAVASHSLLSNPYWDWVSPFVDLGRAGISAENPRWVRFWLYEVDAARMPRWWVQTAVEILQSARRTTDGTPCDAQLATYTLESDVFVTADVALHNIINRCRDRAPVKMARSILITPTEGQQFAKVLDRISG